MKKAKKSTPHLKIAMRNDGIGWLMNRAWRMRQGMVFSWQGKYAEFAELMVQKILNNITM